MKRIPVSAAVVTVLLAGSLLLGCGDDDKPTKPEPEPWLNASRHLWMACANGRPEYSSNPGLASRSYNRFVLVDADTVRTKDSPTLQHLRIDDIADIEFPNKDVIYQSVTRF